MKFHRWEIPYAFLFSTMVTFAFVIVLKYQVKRSRPLPLFLGFLFLQYLAVSFVLSLSRDSALLAFLIFSFGLWANASLKFGRAKIAWVLVSLSSMIIGMTFRPWLSFSLPFLVLGLNRIIQVFEIRLRKLLFPALGTLMLVSLPLALDQTFHKAQELVPSYPQQQVMIMDLSSMACLSADVAQTKNALMSLQKIANSERLTKEILCSQFYPQNWASVVFYGATNGSNSALRMIKPGDESTYIQLQDSWLTTILNQFPAYIQTKLMIGSQFLLAGESPSFSHGSIQGLITLPFELTKALRIFSALPVLLLLVVMTFSKRRFLWDSRAIAIISGFYLTFLGISMIAFIGDNQRYILPGAIIVYFLLFLRNTWSDNVTL